MQFLMKVRVRVRCIARPSLGALQWYAASEPESESELNLAKFKFEDTQCSKFGCKCLPVRSAGRTQAGSLSQPASGLSRSRRKAATAAVTASGAQVKLGCSGTRLGLGLRG